MVLETDVPLARVVDVRDTELVRRAIGSFPRLRPLVEVHAGHLLAIDLHLDEVPVAVITTWFHSPAGFIAFRVGFTRP